MVHDTVDELAREKESSVVPAAPSDPATPRWSCDGWHVATDTGSVVVVVVVVVNGMLGTWVVVVGASVVDVTDFEGEWVHAPRPTANATIPRRSASRDIFRP
jgi:hypothetical protein